MLIIMARHSISQKLVDSLVPKDRYFDITAIGHRGFGVRVSPKGRKCWFYRYRLGGSIRFLNLGYTTSMGLDAALSKYKSLKTKRDEGEDPQGWSPAAQEADYLFMELFKIFDYGKKLPSPIHDLPTLDDFSLHFRVHPSSVRKLASYKLVGLVEKGGETCVVPYPLRITASFLSGLIID
jgi:hypothetical protein